MRRKGLGRGLGKGYRNIAPMDSHVHSLSAKGIKLKQPKVTLLSPNQFDKKFANSYASNEVGYATTKIHPDGSVKVYAKYYPDDVEKTGKLVHHELAEVEIWKDLVNDGMNPDYAEEVAHNKNPVKIDGVDTVYKLDSERSLNGADFGFETLGDDDWGFDTLDAKGTKKVDLKKYLGKWNEQASFPTWFQKGCIDTSAEYRLRDDGKVAVINSCEVDGKKKVATGVAEKVDDNLLKVSFGLPFIKGDYLIEYVDKDYEHAIVGHPDKKYLWILSRDKDVPLKKYNELVRIAKNKGYDTSRLEMTE